MSSLNQNPSQTLKQPRVVLNNIFAFPPNRDTLGGTAYFIVRNEGNILIDCPAWDNINQDFIRLHGGVRWLFISHRGAIGKTAEIQQAFNCKIVIQEHEAYLLPGLTLTTFGRELKLNPASAIATQVVVDIKPANTNGSIAELIWTPGHSPGSSCLYYSDFGGVLFTGRHILPNPKGEVTPIRTAKTFHWFRQIKSLKLLLEKFSPETLSLSYICPGANTGFLRGERLIENPYLHLKNLDLEALEKGE
ncbi:MBL fold metallo-hydrolase [Brunnivagina elsteri]|uniref:MBL fold metallo-hydrolase n=1 Tax=Brunnivagina elsteri CCALA 953 TaxID=987040 RepID=A0A2A2TET2_9CYAN|nr:MBL fold metallo-hydrolase [Calothrix elsteri]PAX52201.1 MBL fold metallo-hydrolase [Calothrix elsteri CCALA 953]